MRRLDPENVPAYLDGILRAIRSIEVFVGEADEAEFIANEYMNSAVIRKIEVIGLASDLILKSDPAFQTAHPELPLRIAYEMRNVLAHDYDSIVLPKVWRTVKEDLPLLRQAAAIIRREYEPKQS